MGSTLVCGYIGSQRSTPPVLLLCWNWKSRANPVVCGYPGSKERVIHSFLCFFNPPPLPRHNGILYSHNISTTLAILSSRGEKRKKEKRTGLAKEVVGLWYILDHIFMLQLLQQGDLSNGCAGYTFWFPASHHRKGSVQDLQQLNKRRKQND